MSRAVGGRASRVSLVHGAAGSPADAAARSTRVIRCVARRSLGIHAMWQKCVFYVCREVVSSNSERTATSEKEREKAEVREGCAGAFESVCDVLFL